MSCSHLLERKAVEDATTRLMTAKQFMAMHATMHAIKQCCCHQDGGYLAAAQPHIPMLSNAANGTATRVLVT
jgi:hypothetical protein